MKYKYMQSILLSKGPILRRQFDAIAGKRLQAGNCEEKPYGREVKGLLCVYNGDRNRNEIVFFYPFLL